MLEVKILNRTNGQYPDSQVYWSFNGQTQSIAAAAVHRHAGQLRRAGCTSTSARRTASTTTSSSSPSGASSINVDTTRVDRFGLKLAMLLHAHDGSNQEVGENYATFQESRAATFHAVPELGADRVQGTGHRPGAVRHPVAGQRPGVPARRRVRELLHQLRGRRTATPPTPPRRSSAAAARWPPTRRCAPRSTGTSRSCPRRSSPIPANFYQAAPANYYAQFWHENAINGLQYGFPYDDDAGPVLGHLDHQPAVHGRRRRLVAAGPARTAAAADERPRPPSTRT